MTRTGRIIIASTRAAAGIYDDRSGPMIAEWFVEQGFSAPGIVVVPDGDPVGRALRIAVADGVDVVITSGGTGISPAVAQTMVSLGVDLSRLTTLRNLQEALKACMHWIDEAKENSRPQR